MRILTVIKQVSDRAGAKACLRDIVTRTLDTLQHGIAVLGAANNQFSPFEAIGGRQRPPLRLELGTHGGPGS